MKRKSLIIIGMLLPLGYFSANAEESKPDFSAQQMCRSLLSGVTSLPDNIIPVQSSSRRSDRDWRYSGGFGLKELSVEDRVKRWQEDNDRKVRYALEGTAVAKEALLKEIASPEQKHELNQDYINDSLFIVPGNDGEAVMAIDVLKKAKAPYLQASRQGWGATLDKEMIEEVILNKVKRVVIFEMPSVELEEYLTSRGLEVVVVDHHDYAHFDLYRHQDISSLEQLAALIGYKLSEAEIAVSINDQDYIPGMKRRGLTEEQIRSVRRYDLVSQGKRYRDVVEDEERAMRFLNSVKKINGVYVLEKTRGLTPFIYAELGMKSEDGSFNAVEFVEPNKIGFSGSKDFIKKIMKIDFESFGYPKGSYDLYAAGGGSLMGFKIKRDVRIEKAYNIFEKLKAHVLNMIKAEVSLSESKEEAARLKAQSEIEEILSEAGDQPISVEDINYKTFGEENTETLVLIHGLDSAWQTFENVIPELSKKYKVLVLDQRGHGGSADKTTDFSSFSMAGDLKTVLDHLKISKAHILGHSMGARTATRFASMFPESVTSLIIEDMELFGRVSLKNLEGKDINKDIFERSAKMKAEFDGKTFLNRDELIKALTPYYGDESESLTYRRAKENTDGTMQLLFRPWISILYSFQGNLEDFSKELSEIDVPVLVMQADPKKGTALSKNGVEHIKENSSGAQVEFFNDAGHTIHRADEEGFLNRLGKFLGLVVEENKIKVRIRDYGVLRNRKVESEGMLPRGSALITSSGDLADKGITNIIHAASGAMGKSGNFFDPTLESVRNSVRNSIKLAMDNGHTRVAIPFIGGSIFAERIGVSQEEIAKEIVSAAAYYASFIEIRFVAFRNDDTDLFKKLVSKSRDLLRESAGVDEIVLNGSLTDFDLHGASAIINAANMEVVFGAGLSGAISNATNRRIEINEEAQRGIREYYKR